jgi:hypothetical protein
VVAPPDASVQAPEEQMPQTLRALQVKRALPEDE